MNCESTSGYFMKYFDKSLNDIELAKMKQHLKVCEKCNVEFEGINEIFNVLEAEAQIEPPPDFELNIMEKVGLVEFERKKRNDRFMIMLYSLISISIVFVSLLFFQFFKGLTFIEMMQNIIEQFSTFSSTFFVLYEVTGKLGNAFLGVMGTLFQVSLILLKTYHYVFTILLGMLLILDSMFRKLIRQDDGGVG